MSYQLPTTRELNRSVVVLGKLDLLKKEEYTNLPHTQNHLINSVLNNNVNLCSGPLASGKTTAAFIAADLLHKRTLCLIDDTLETLDVVCNIQQKVRIRMRMPVRSIICQNKGGSPSIIVAQSSCLKSVNLNTYDFIILDTVDNALINAALEIQSKKVLVLTENSIGPEYKDKNGVVIECYNDNKINKITLAHKDEMRSKKPVGERTRNNRRDTPMRYDDYSGKQKSESRNDVTRTGFNSQKQKGVVIYDYEDRFAILSKLFEDERTSTIGVYLNSKDDFDDISSYLRRIGTKFTHNLNREGVNLIFQCTNRKLFFNISINYKLNTVDEMISRRGSKVITFLEKSNSNLRKEVLDYLKENNHQVPRFIESDILPEKFDAFDCTPELCQDVSSDTELWG